MLILLLNQYFERGMYLALFPMAMAILIKEQGILCKLSPMVLNMQATTYTSYILEYTPVNFSTTKSTEFKIVVDFFSLEYDLRLSSTSDFLGGLFV